MKKYLLLGFLGLILVGCNEKVIDKSQREVIDNLVYEVNNAKPYTGKITSMYPDGRPQFEGHYKDGKKNGVFKQYYENGQLEFEAAFKNGKKDRVAKKYYENGLVEAEWSYKDGKEYGVHKSYYENGQVEYELNYNDGTYKVYDKNGWIVYTN